MSGLAEPAGFVGPAEFAEAGDAGSVGFAVLSLAFETGYNFEVNL